jgi:multidrug efflux pump subunit AcrA (membrane-fusion protein)
VLEVVVNGSADEELAIPQAATIRNGLEIVLYRRHRSNPEVVEQVTADLGASDGRWVVINSGLKEGDEVVVGGIYPLKLSQQGGASQAGHFEADGTFHVGSH